MSKPSSRKQFLGQLAGLAAAAGLVGGVTSVQAAQSPARAKPGHTPASPILIRPDARAVSRTK